MNELALFTGAGGGVLGSVLCGWSVVAGVEADPRCREIEAPPLRPRKGRGFRGVKHLVFQGSSDDTFGEESTGCDYDNCASGKPIRILVEDGNDRLVVIGQYAAPGVAGWSIAVGPVDSPDHDAKEGIAPIPDWNVRISQSGSVHYSPVLEMDVPDSTVLQCLEERDDD